MTTDPRVTPGLIHEVLDALERHGHYRRDDQHADRVTGLIGELASIYEAAQDHPAYPGPGRRDVITLTRDDASTIFAASDIAAGDKRYRAGMCPDCPDQSCPDCQTHLRDARAFDQMAGRMLRALEAAPAAGTSRPGPDRRPQPAADREAGQ
jgi:hypothetical protein